MIEEIIVHRHGDYFPHTLRPKDICRDQISALPFARRLDSSTTTVVSSPMTWAWTYAELFTSQLELKLPNSSLWLISCSDPNILPTPHRAARTLLRDYESAHNLVIITHQEVCEVLPIEIAHALQWPNIETTFAKGTNIMRGWACVMNCREQRYELVGPTL